MKDGNRYTVQLVDISESGLGAIAQFNPKKGSLCSINTSVFLAPPHPIKLSCQAIVVNSIYSAKADGFKLGLEFKSIPQELALILKQALNPLETVA